MKSEYTAGYYESEEFSKSKSEIHEINGNYYKFLIGIDIVNAHKKYDKYQRRRITELDVLSTISALFTPIKLVFLFIYRFYSNNFNNYKMIENILNQKYKNNKTIELKDLSEKKDSSIKDLNDNEDSKDKEDDNDSEFRLNKKERILPKYSFMQFFLNNIYCKSWKRCAKYARQQEILEICNTIYIIWIPSPVELKGLNNIKNNQLILKLKTLIK